MESKKILAREAMAEPHRVYVDCGKRQNRELELLTSNLINLLGREIQV